MGLGDRLRRAFRRPVPDEVVALATPGQEIDLRDVLWAVSWLKKQGGSPLLDVGEARGIRSDIEGAGAFQQSSPDAHRRGVLSFDSMNRVYEQNALVRAVVDTKCRQIAGLEWDVNPPDEDTVSDPFAKARVKRLLNRPNSNGDSWTEFWLSVLRDIFVLDAGAIEKVRTADARLVELVPLDGSTIIPFADTHGRLTGYRQVVKQRDGKELTAEFGPRDLIYFRANPSTRKLWGFSPLESLSLEIGADVFGMQHNISAFTDGNLADHLLIMGRAGAAVLERMNEAFEAIKGRGWQLPIIKDVEDGGAGAKLFTLKSTNRDMEFQQFEQWVFQRICAVYQTSADEIIQLQAHLTRAAGESQREIHADKGTGPELAIIAHKLTQHVVSEFSPDLEFLFTEKSKTDELEEAQVWATFAGSGRPLNELRRERGLEPFTQPTVILDNGDEVCVYDYPLNMQTGQILGLDVSGGASTVATAALQGAWPFPMNSGTGGGIGGGALLGGSKPEGGTGWPFLARTNKSGPGGRRQPSPHPNPQRSALARWEKTRSELAQTTAHRVPGSAKAGHGCACGTCAPVADSGGVRQGHESGGCEVAQ
jgi:hypothetical protein